MIRRILSLFGGPPPEPEVTAYDSLRDHLVRFEGKRLKAYACPAGKATIGVGATRTLGNRPVQLGMEITEEQCEALLQRDAGKVLEQAAKMLRVDATQHALVAYADLIYNFGFTAIRGSEAVRFYNEGDLKSAEKHFKQWRGVRKGKKFRVLPGLVRRRAAAWKILIEGERQC